MLRLEGGLVDPADPVIHAYGMSAACLQTPLGCIQLWLTAEQYFGRS